MDEELTTAERYRRFAEHVARPESARSERLTEGVAADPEVLRFLDGLPVAKRHPQLFLASVRHLGGAPETSRELRAWVLGHQDELARTMLRRSVQVNDVGRCAPVLPLLSALPQPLALLEVGAAAGLCLFPDRYRYDFSGHQVGSPSSPVRLTCSVEGHPPLPVGVPRIAWRAGVDREPLDVGCTDDVAWLEALLWPGQPDRVATLRAAVAIARAEPPLLVRGDLNERLAELAGRAPGGATLVVLNCAVLSYLDAAERERFVRQVRNLGAYWISVELPFVFPGISARIRRPPPADRATYVVMIDGGPVARASMHGDWLDWLGS